ncbi:MAG: hypothetical protein MZV64_09915 [Ignavibacteriales bacterium]|nr:hypothetical protein [Ignavibacteriales bacterium]
MRNPAASAYDLPRGGEYAPCPDLARTAAGVPAHASTDSLGDPILNPAASGGPAARRARRGLRRPGRSSGIGGPGRAGVPRTRTSALPYPGPTRSGRPPPQFLRSDASMTSPAPGHRLPGRPGSRIAKDLYPRPLCRHRRRAHGLASRRYRLGTCRGPAASCTIRSGWPSFLKNFQWGAGPLRPGQVHYVPDGARGCGRRRHGSFPQPLYAARRGQGDFCPDGKWSRARSLAWTSRPRASRTSCKRGPRGVLPGAACFFALGWDSTSTDPERPRRPPALDRAFGKFELNRKARTSPSSPSRDGIAARSAARPGR